MQSSILFLQRVSLYYGLGSFMGAVSVFANWSFRELLGGGLAILAVKPDLEDYYMPMVWGGAWALVFLVPLRWFSWVGRGVILGLGPGFSYLSLKAGGADRLVDFISPDRFLRHDTLIVLLVYMFVWGLGVSYLVSKTDR